MRFTILIGIFFLAFHSFAAEKVKLSEAKKFISDGKICEFAVSEKSPLHGFLRIPDDGGKNPLIIAEGVFCVTDLVESSGTIRERSGCTLTRFNLVTGKYMPYHPNDTHPMVQGSDCLSGFEKLMEIRIPPVVGLFMVHVKDNPTVADILTRPQFDGPLYIIHSTNEKFSRWWDKRVAENAKKANLKAKDGTNKKQSSPVKK